MNEGEGTVAKTQDCTSWFLSGMGNVEKQSKEAWALHGL